MKYIKLFEDFESFWDKYEEHQYLDLDIMENGDLKIILNSDGKEEAEDSGIDYNRFYDFFDDISANSDMKYYDDMGDTGLGMSSAPCIITGYEYDDNGNIVIEETGDTGIYWYPEYMVKDFTEELVKKGYVIFTTYHPKTKEEIEKRKLEKDTKKYNI